MSDINIDFLLKKSPEEIVRWFENKGYKPSWDWNEVWQKSHAKTFTVAKAMKFDILRDIHKELCNSFKHGTTYETFAKRLEPILKKKGWWGKVKAKDVPGYSPKVGIDPEKVVQLGSPQRLKKIYRINQNVAYNSGRYKSQLESSESHPYWRYIQLDRPTKRPAHKQFHGKVIRWDDPIWDVIYPPSDWECACRVQSLSKLELERSGLSLSKGQDFDTSIIPEEWRYNPGKSAFFEKGNSSAIPNQQSWEDYKRPDIAQLDDSYFTRPGILPRCGSIDSAVEQATNTLGITGYSKIIKTPYTDVIILKDKLPHLFEKRPEGRERFCNHFLETLLNPFEVYLTEFEDGYRLTYIGLFKKDLRNKGKDYNLISSIRIGKQGNVVWNIMHQKNTNTNEKRKGILVYTKNP